MAWDFKFRLNLLRKDNSMARAQSADYFHNFKFHVSAESNALGLVTEGGFSTCSLPEVTLDVIEYKEGIHVYKRKFPGNPTVSDVSLGRGVAKTRTAFMRWILACIEGREYRADVTIWHFHRDDITLYGLDADPNTIPGANAGRIIKLKNAFGIRHKPGSDFDSQGTEVSIEELDISCESFEVVSNQQLVTANLNIKN